MYNEVILEHFQSPRNLGVISNANGIGTVGDPDCGDFLRIYLIINDNIIQDISFLCQGCPAAIACGSATTELAKFKSIDEAFKITEMDISNYLCGLSEQKMHCSNLGIAALRYAIADYMGHRIMSINNINIIERVRNKAKLLALQEGLLDQQLIVRIKKLPPETAIGINSERDLPIWKGIEGIVEAKFINGIGQAYTPVPIDFSGSLAEIFDLDLSGIDESGIGNRGVFVAAINALCNHLEIVDKTIHCRDSGPSECAKDLIRIIGFGSPKDSRITLVGCQPRMIESLYSSYSLRVLDLDPDKIGTKICGIEIEGEESTDEALEWCTIALVTGSTIVNGSIDRFIGLKCHTVFYGVTIAGAAALLGLNRFCTRAE